MEVGYFGDMKFVVSSKKINSFSDFKRTVTGVWQEHSLYNSKPESEFLGAGLQNVSFTVVLDISLGVTPEKEVRKWVKLVENGKVGYLVIGSRKIGSKKWKVTEITEQLNAVFANGRIIKSQIDVTMSEY
ncbi:MAG: phage tail protein [Velocimicrobium sp.]